MDIFSSFELRLNSLLTENIVEIFDDNKTIRTITIALIKKVENYLKETKQYLYHLKHPNEKPILKLAYASNSEINQEEIKNLYNELNNKNVNFNLILK